MCRALALTTGDRVWVVDVATSPIYAGHRTREVMLTSGSRAVLTYPLRHERGGRHAVDARPHTGSPRGARAAGRSRRRGDDPCRAGGSRLRTPRSAVSSSASHSEGETSVVKPPAARTRRFGGVCRCRWQRAAGDEPGDRAAETSTGSTRSAARAAQHQTPKRPLGTLPVVCAPEPSEGTTSRPTTSPCSNRGQGAEYRFRA